MNTIKMHTNQTHINQLVVLKSRYGTILAKKKKNKRNSDYVT